MLNALNDHEALGVPLDANPAQVAAAHKRLSRVVHPDRVRYHIQPGHLSFIAVNVAFEAAMTRVNTARDNLVQDGERQRFLAARVWLTTWLFVKAYLFKGHLPELQEARHPFNAYGHVEDDDAKQRRSVCDGSADALAVPQS